MKPNCLIDGCDGRYEALGLCTRHYQQHKAHGGLPIKRRRNVPFESEAFLRDHVNWKGAECLEWPYKISTHGYGRAGVSGIAVSAHRAMCILAHGEPPFDGAMAAHKCAKRNCVNPQHLYWATAHENMRDMIEHGNSLAGAKNPSARLTPDLVLQILSDPRPNKETAIAFGVSRDSVLEIRNGTTWSSVTGLPRKPR